MPKITIFFILLCKFKKYNTFYVKILFMMQDVVLAQNIAFCANFAEFCFLRKIAQNLLRMMRNIAQNLFRSMRKMLQKKLR